MLYEVITIVTNTSSGADRIVAVRLDLSTAMFPDMVFDPDGAAGDAAAKRNNFV